MYPFHHFDKKVLLKRVKFQHRGDIIKSSIELYVGMTFSNRESRTRYRKNKTMTLSRLMESPIDDEREREREERVKRNTRAKVNEIQS